MPSLIVNLLLLSAVVTQSASAQFRASPADSLLARSILAELVGIRSVSGTRETVEAANAIVRRLRAAGFSEQDAFVAGKADSVGNVVARLRGGGRALAPPILLMAHLDVVPALREDWSTDPFVMTEKDGWWYGRGTIDNKEGVATIVTNLIRWKRDKFVPDRDIVAVLTGDEETVSDQIEWFASGEGRRLIGDPEFAVNFDAGGGTIYNGRDAMLGVQTSEKIYVTYKLTVRNAGGHSSQPRADNAIYALAGALSRLAAHRFPIEVSAAARLALERSAPFEADSIAALMRRVARQPMDNAAATKLTAITRFNAQLRTTCVATRLTGGHADNALPQLAQATVNCRVLPGSDTAVVSRALRQAVADTAVVITEAQPATVSPPSPLKPAILNAVDAVGRRFWPGVVVVPVMSSGATDGMYVRKAGIPVYGIGGIFTEPDESRAHGRDERVEIKRFYEGVEFAKAVVERLTQPSSQSVSARQGDLSAIAKAKADSARYPYTVADVHFMTAMIGHHAQALEMASWAPTHGASASVRTLAGRIINGQQDEIVTMQLWLRDRLQPAPAAGAGGMKMMMNGVEHEMLMPGMLTAAQMKQLDEASGPEFDRRFITFMIQHHRGAISMVNDLLSSQGAAQDQTVFKLASDVHADQSTEIERMEKMLAGPTIPTRSR